MYNHSMKSTVTLITCLVVLCLQSGCITSVISTPVLLKQKRIDAHKTYELENGESVNAWVILSRPETGPTGKFPATALLLHPLLEDKAWFLSLGERLAKEGWNVVLPDLRGHGHSKSRGVTWGALEKQDLTLLMSRLIDDGLATDNIYVMGASYGGSTALLYAIYDLRCSGVIAVAPPDGSRGAKEISFPFRSDEYIDKKVNDDAFRLNFTPLEASPSQKAAMAKIPLIMVRAKLDMVVPSKQVKRIYAAWNGPKVMEELFADRAGVQIGRDKWYAKQMKRLLEMSEAD